jgi:hypothetical protein
VFGSSKFSGVVGGTECVRRAAGVEVKSPPPELSAVEEPYRKIVEEVAAYVAERGRLEKEKYNELYHRFRERYSLPALGSTGHEPRRGDRHVVSRAEEKRPSPQTPSRGSAGFDKIR